MRFLKHLLLFFFFAFLTLSSLAQSDSLTLKVLVKSSGTHRLLKGAWVYDMRTNKGAFTDSEGLCRLTFKKGDYKIGILLNTYNIAHYEVYMQRDLFLRVYLNKAVELDEVQVKANMARPFLKIPQMSETEVDSEILSEASIAAGEMDLMRFIQLLPDVVAADDASRTYVRGGDADQNQVLYDGARVYNANHIFGLFSIFNDYAIDGFSLYSGNFPVQYGGALSSVIDVKPKQYKSDDFSGVISLGLLVSKFSLNGPVQKAKSYFSLSARGMYTDPLSRNLFTLNKYSDLAYKFYDFNFSFNHAYSKRSKLSFSLYRGHDYGSGQVHYDKKYSDYFKGGSYTNYDLTEYNDVDWGNTLFTLRWDYMLNRNVSMKLRLSYSNYKSSTLFNSVLINRENEDESAFNFDFSSSMNDLSFKTDFICFPSETYAFTIGTSFIAHSFEPAVNKMSARDDINPDYSPSSKFTRKGSSANEFAAYFKKDINVVASLKADIGMRLSLYSVGNTMYKFIQPRLSVGYMINDDLTLKTSFTQMNQYIHMISNSSMHMPADQYLHSTDIIEPMQASQLTLGALYVFGDYFLNVETYYKTMDNLLAVKDGVTFFGSTKNWEDKVEIGTGLSYGIEIMLRKKMGTFTGWLTYSLAKSTRTFDNLNNAEPFAADYDRRHSICLVLSRKVSKKIDYGLSWVYGSGNPVTVSNTRLNIASSPNSPIAGNSAIAYDGPNSLRGPSYHRLDLSINFRKQKRGYERIWNITMFNAYGQTNPFYLYMGSQFNDDGSVSQSVKQRSLLWVLPSVSYIIKF